MDCVMNNKQIKQLSLVTKSIAHPLHLNILSSLTDQELTDGELAAIAKTSSANLSQHLSILRTNDLLNTRRAASYHYKSIADCRIMKLIKASHDLHYYAQHVQKSTSFPHQ